MKKMMMAAFAVVLAAGMASAANMNWNITANWGTRPDGSAWNTDNQTPSATPIYYALILAVDFEAATTAIMADGFVVNTSGGGESGVFLGWGVTTANRGGSANAGSPNIASSAKILTTQQDYIALAFGQGNEGVWYYAYSGVTADKIGYTTSPDDGTAASWGNAAWGTAVGGSGGWIPIPEPTAMALLALGAAAVGLRRRFRK